MGFNSGLKGLKDLLLTCLMTAQEKAETHSLHVTVQLELKQNLCRVRCDETVCLVINTTGWLQLRGLIIFYCYVI